MPSIYSCFFRGRSHSKDDVSRLSNLSSQTFQDSDLDYDSEKSSSMMPAIIRQESFKRSRSFVEASPSQISIPAYETADAQPKIEGLTTVIESANGPVNEKNKPTERGLKRKNAVRCFDDAVIVVTPESQQVEIANKIANYLMKMHKGTKEPLPMFIGEQMPAISFPKYVERLVKFTNRWAEEKDGPDSIGVRCAVIAVQYLERADVKLACKAIHRYFMIAYLLGIKLIFDYYMSNSFWGDVAGCPLKKVNEMEMEFCSSLGWVLSIDEDLHRLQLSKFVQTRF